MAKDGFASLNEVGRDFSFFDLLYIKEWLLNIEGNIWRLKDFIVRIGKIKLGESFTYILLQVEYLPNSLISNFKIIFDFLRQILVDDFLFKGFTTLVLKSFVYENEKESIWMTYEEYMKKIKYPNEIEQTMRPRDNLF